MMTAQTTHPRWSFFVSGGAGLQDIVPLSNLTIPDEAKGYLNKRGIYSLNIPTQACSPWSPAANIGVSYNANARWRFTLHAGNQNIMQQNYHAMVFSSDVLAGYNLIRHPHHTFYTEVGIGGYFSWNSMNYLWKGKDGDGNQIVIDGVPEEIFVNLGRHDTRNVSLPVKLSYQYNLHGHHWLGTFVQGRVNPFHEDFAPLHTASAGVEYRYTIGYTKKKMAHKPSTRRTPSIVLRHDTIYIERIVERVVERIVHDTIYVEMPVLATPTQQARAKAEWVFFDLSQHVVPPYEQERLQNLDFSGVRSVSITAFTCGLGSEKFNQRLARQRLNAVARLLQARGVTINRQDIFVSSDVSPRFRSVKIEFNQ